MRTLAACLAIVALLACGCTQAKPVAQPALAPVQLPAPDAVVDLVMRHRLTLEGPATVESATIPSYLEDNGWALKSQLSASIGLPLRRAAGSRVDLMRFPVSQRVGQQSLDLYVVSRRGEIVGAYLGVRATGAAAPAPGLFSLGDPGLTGLADTPSGRPDKRFEPTPRALS